MSFEPLKESLNRSLNRGPLKPIVTALNVEAVAKKVLPPWATPLSFREGRLIIATPSPSHSQELYLQAKRLIKEINEDLGRKVVEQIKSKAKGLSAV